MPSDPTLYAETAAEQLRRWDAGETIWTVEMGGLGPGYEQAIQILAIEIVRDHLDQPLPNESTWQTWGDATVARIDQPDANGHHSCGGFSGGQVGAAKHLALGWLRDGPEIYRAKFPQDRHIQCSNFWPRVANLNL